MVESVYLGIFLLLACITYNQRMWLGKLKFSMKTTAKPQKMLPEERLVRFCRERGGKITIFQAATAADISESDAENLLNLLVEKGWMSCHTNKTGTLIYAINMPVFSNLSSDNYSLSNADWTLPKAS